MLRALQCQRYTPFNDLQSTFPPPSSPRILVSSPPLIAPGLLNWQSREQSYCRLQTLGIWRRILYKFITCWPLERQLQRLLSANRNCGCSVVLKQRNEQCWPLSAVRLACYFYRCFPHERWYSSRWQSGTHHTSGRRCDMQELKVVVVGDSSVGKTCFLYRFTENSFPGEYIPMAYDSYTFPRMLDGVPYNLGLWDLPGKEEYDPMRPQAYLNTDVFLICFDVGNRASFENVTGKWFPEVRRFMPGTPILVVGNKIDLRSES